MNRIVKRQGVAPPWIELQNELDLTLSNFRAELRSNWVRRATRMRSLDAITKSVLAEVRGGWRDVEWEAKERFVVSSCSSQSTPVTDAIHARSYHKASVTALNNLLRRYNVIAPYHVRRAQTSLEHELASCVRDSAEIIASELYARLHGTAPEQLEVKEIPAVADNLWDAVKRIFASGVK